MSRLLSIRVVTPTGCETCPECDDVTLIAADNAEGLGGGSVGIRPGHIAAVIALAPSSVVKASLNGRQVFQRTVTKGVAQVRGDVVTVITQD